MQDTMKCALHELEHQAVEAYNYLSIAGCDSLPFSVAYHSVVAVIVRNWP